MLGDAANLASRLEGANKPFGTYLMVSDATWGQARNEFFAREIGSIMVVGRKAPVRVFEVLGSKGEPEPPWLEQWAMAILACQAGHWKKANAVFATFTDDPLAAKYRDHTAKLLNGELTGWDGVWKLTEK